MNEESQKIDTSGIQIKQKKSYTLYILGGILVIVFISSVVVILEVGKRYKGGLSQFMNEQTSQRVHSIKKKQIRKITIKKRGESDCFSVTPDGVVRRFAECDDNLTDADRITNTKNILKLFKILSEIDLTKYKEKRDGAYELVIETEDGLETIYIDIGEDTGEIIEIIEDIEEEIPASSPEPSIFESPSSSGQVSPSPFASGGYYATPTPTPSGGFGQTSFTCEFTDAQGNRKPYNVSNIICSTEPSPIP